MSAITLLNPYQLIGTKIPAGMSNEDAIRYTGLGGWNQRLVKPELRDENGLPIDVGNLRINVGDLPVNEDGDRVPTALGPVTTAYKPFQHEEKFSSLLDGFAANGMQCSIMGAYANGKATYAVFDLPEEFHQTLKGEVHRFVVATDRSDGTGSAKAFTAAERPWCGNMITGLAKKVAVSIRHTRYADPYLLQQVEVLLGLTSDWDRALAREVAALQQQRVTRRQFADVVVPALMGDRPEEKGRSQTMFDNKFDGIVAAWNSPAAADGETGWRAYNAVTEFEQHHRSRNNRVMAEATMAERLPLEKQVVGVLAGLR